MSGLTGSGFVVTGGAGFIGSHLVDELMVQGHEVTVVDNFSEGKESNIRQWLGHERFNLVRGDIRDAELMRRVIDGKFAVFHLAGCSRIQPSITDPAMAFSQNVMGTLNIAEAARKGGVKRVVYSASSSAYGRKNDWVFEVGEDDHLSDPRGRKEHRALYEDMPTDCLNPYSLTKKCGEEIMDVYHRLYDLSTVSLRYFNVYGPRHQEEGAYATVVAIFRRQRRLNQPLTIVGDGEQRRDFTFVSDVVRANMLAMMNWEATGVYNVGAGRNYSINEVASLVGGPTVNIPPREGEARVTLADYSKINDALGWEPMVHFADGLQIIDEWEKRFHPSGLIV
jgi:UDP-glucose 4-epimerase